MRAKELRCEGMLEVYRLPKICVEWKLLLIAYRNRITAKVSGKVRNPKPAPLKSQTVAPAVGVGSMRDGETRATCCSTTRSCDCDRSRDRTGGDERTYLRILNYLKTSGSDSAE